MFKEQLEALQEKYPTVSFKIGYYQWKFSHIAEVEKGRYSFSSVLPCDEGANTEDDLTMSELVSLINWLLQA